MTRSLASTRVRELVNTCHKPDADDAVQARARRTDSLMRTLQLPAHVARSEDDSE